MHNVYILSIMHIYVYIHILSVYIIYIQYISTMCIVYIFFFFSPSQLTYIMKDNVLYSKATNFNVNLI